MDTNDAGSEVMYWHLLLTWDQDEGRGVHSYRHVRSILGITDSACLIGVSHDETAPSGTQITTSYCISLLPCLIALPKFVVLEELVSFLSNSTTGGA